MSDYEIGFDEDTGFTDEEKRQVAEEVRLAFAIAQGSMPMARGLGISPDVLDRGAANAGNPLIAEIMDELEGMDERISVTEVRVEYGADGQARTKVIIERADDT